LAKNIPNIQVYVGGVSVKLIERIPTIGNYITKEAPSKYNVFRTRRPRDWMFNVKVINPSFFAFWRNVKRKLRF